MSALVARKVKAKSLELTNDYLVVYLDDARIIQVPLIWYPALYSASKKQLKNYRWIGKGSGIAWPDLDEHLSIHGFLQGCH